MGKGIIIVSIIAIVIMLGLVVGYFFFNEEEIKQGYANVSLYAIDGRGDYVKTGYEMYLDNILYKTSSTNPKGPLRIKIAVGKNVRISNINLDDQNYYSNIITFHTKNNSVHRAEMRLYEPGKFKVSQLDKEDEQESDSGENNFNLNVSTDRVIKNVAFCVDWSTHFVFVKSKNQDYTEIKIPPRFKGYIKCYETKKTIGKEKFLEISKEDISEERSEMNNECDECVTNVTNRNSQFAPSLNLSLRYMKFGKITQSDYINVVIFDGIEKPNKIDYGEDIGNEDYEFPVNINNL